MTKARDLSKLLSTSNGKIAGSNLDVSFENISDTGTEGTKVASGTTAQRGSTTGQWRFNSTTGYFEGINATGGISSLEPDPTITSVDDTEVDSAAGGNQTIVITGTNFTTGGMIAFVGSSAEFNAATTTYNNATQVTAVAPKASFLNAQEPYKVKFTSATGKSGLSATGLINVDNAPTWTTSAGTVATIIDNATGTHATLAASDAEGDTVSYSETGATNITGAGLSLNSSTGVISGDPTDVSNSTTVSFTGRATAGSKTTDRSFNIIINPTPDGSTLAKAATSAKNIYNLGSTFQGASASGLYYLDPDGTGTYAGQYYCRMDYGGGWVLAMQVVREATGNDTFPLATTSARGTMSTNPYSVPTGQTKIHNTPMSSLETADGNGKYDLMLHYWTYNSSTSYPSVQSGQYPTAGTTVATTSNGVPSDSSPYVGRNFYFKSTRTLSGACAGGANDNTGILGNRVSDYNNIYQNMSGSTITDFRNRNPVTETTSSSFSGQDGSVFQLQREAGGTKTEVAYSNRCDDGYTGAYIIDRDFNCYHQYLIWYVR